MMTRRAFLQSLFTLLLLLLAGLGHAALVEKYVSALAAGGGDGSEGSPYTWAEMSAQLTPASTTYAGTRYNVKADGTYSLSANTVWAANGIVGSPIIIRGYKTTPGDGYQGRTNGNGALITDNMPVITYANTYFLTLSGTYLQLDSVNVTGARNGNLVQLSSGNDKCVLRSRFENTASNSGASALGASAANCIMYDCDGYVSGSVSGYAMGGNATFLRIEKCRASNTSATGAGCFVVGAYGVVTKCTALPSSGVGVNLSDNRAVVEDNTIYAQSVADIQTPNAAQTGIPLIVGNMLTDSGRGLLNQYNATANHAVFAAYNRTRDNTSPDLGFGDWPYFNTITTDTGGPETDYKDYAAGDLRIIQTSPAKGAFFGGDIGALQRPEPTLPLAGQVQLGVTYGSLIDGLLTGTLAGGGGVGGISRSRSVNQ